MTPPGLNLQGGVIVESQTRAFSLDPQVEFFRQAGGCIEIHQNDIDDDHSDIVHICGDSDLTVFVAELQAFAREVRGQTGLDPDA